MELNIYQNNQLIKTDYYYDDLNNALNHIINNLKLEYLFTEYSIVYNYGIITIDSNEYSFELIPVIKMYSVIIDSCNIRNYTPRKNYNLIDYLYVYYDNLLDKYTLECLEYTIDKFNNSCIGSFVLNKKYHTFKVWYNLVNL